MNIEKIVVIFAGTPQDVADYVKAESEKGNVIPLAGHQYYCFVSTDTDEIINAQKNELNSVVEKVTGVDIQGLMVAGWEKNHRDTLYFVHDVFYNFYCRYANVVRAEKVKTKFLSALKSRGIE